MVKATVKRSTMDKRVVRERSTTDKWVGMKEQMHNRKWVGTKEQMGKVACACHCDGHSSCSRTDMKLPPYSCGNPSNLIPSWTEAA
jgi:hypothetical protein